MPVSLRRRLQLGLASFAALAAILAAFAIAGLDRLGGAIATILHENYASVVACDDMKEALERLDSAAQFVSSGRGDMGAPMLAPERASFVGALAREAANETLPGEADLVSDVDARYREYVSAVDRVLAEPAADRSTRYFAELLPRFNAIKSRIESVSRMNQANMEDADRKAKTLAERLVQVAIIASLAGGALAIWFVWWLPRAIVRPVEALADVARSIGEGRLDVDVPSPRVVELSPLADAFKRMLEQLRSYRESSLGELLAAKDLSRATLACMIDPVIVFDADGAALLANEAAESAFGVRAGAKDDLGAAGVDLPAEILRARDEVFSSLEAVSPRSLAEAVRKQGAGGERYYLVRAAPIRASKTEPARAIVVAQDVTRFRRIDELKSDMVATVSHEFKTPLTSLRMATHLLLEDATGPLSESQRELVATAKQDTDRLAAMVDDLLDVVRIERDAGALHRVPVDPKALLRGVADAHRTVAKDKAIAIEVVEVSELGPVSLDPSRLSIAISNLVANAVRHTPPSGRVTLRASKIGDALSIEIRDTGEGIPRAKLPSLFEGKSEGRRGLGLVIAREIALEHGGDLAGASIEGKGSTFTLTIPLKGK